MALCGELYCNWEIKAFACAIKVMVLCVRNRQGKGYCNAFFLPKQSKGGFIPILLKSQSIRKVFYLVDLCKQKGIKKDASTKEASPISEIIKKLLSNIIL